MNRLKRTEGTQHSLPDFCLIDDYAARGYRGESYNWNHYDQTTYDAWLVGRRLRGELAPPKEVAEKQDGAAPKVSLHPANWR